MSNLNSVTIQAPATSANCGPGFDTLSLALNLYNRINIKEVDGEPGTFRAPANQTPFSPGSQNLIKRALELFSNYTKRTLNCIELDIHGDIPLTRGLGSSACIRGGLLAGLNAMHETGLDVETLIRLTSQLEDSADNATALFKGGFCVTRVTSDTHMYVHSLHFDVSESLSIALLSPDIKVNTPHARSILPTTLPFRDVVNTMNSLAYLVGVMALKKYELLREAVSDFVHEPFRKTLTPLVDETIEAGMGAGAYTGWISGSGSSIVCLCPQEQITEVTQAMKQVYDDNALGCKVFELHAENRGLRVL